MNDTRTEMNEMRMGIKKSYLLTAVLIGGLSGEEAGRAQGPVQKPFENIYRRPTVSAYNQISNMSNNPLLLQNVYQQTIQPQLQQQQQQIEQLQQRRQIQQVQSQVANMNSPRSRQLDESIRPTGHASTYMNYSHYYGMRR
jgi:hypothetical protein